MENVTWDECQQFIEKLNTLTGEHYRLPTEAEWEFAARGGNMSKGYKYAGSNVASDVAWYSGNSGKRPHNVGEKKPNELGLYDNVGQLLSCGFRLQVRNLKRFHPYCRSWQAIWCA